MKLLPIPLDQVDSMWGYIEPIIKKAVDLTPDRISTQDLYDSAKAGGYLLWIVCEEENEKLIIQAVLSTRVLQYPKTKALAIDFVAGQKMKDWLRTVMEKFEELGKLNQCTHIEGYGRKAWQKYLNEYGWKQRHIQYEKRLDNEQGQKQYPTGD